MLTRSLKLSAILLSVTVSFVGINTAHADIITPDVESCAGKKAGDACELQGKSGQCIEFQRCRPTPDGSEDCSTSYRCDTTRQPEAKPGTKEPTEEPEEAKEPAHSGSGACAQSGLSPSDDMIPVASLLAGLCLFGVLRRKRS